MANFSVTTNILSPQGPDWKHLGCLCLPSSIRQGRGLGSSNMPSSRSFSQRHLLSPGAHLLVLLFQSADRFFKFRVWRPPCMEKERLGSWLKLHKYPGNPSRCPSSVRGEESEGMEQGPSPPIICAQLTLPSLAFDALLGNLLPLWKAAQLREAHPHH